MIWPFVLGGIGLLIVVWRIIIYFWDKKFILVLPSGKRYPKVEYINHRSELDGKTYKVKVIYNSRIGRILMPSTFLALTIRNRIYIDGTPATISDHTIKHELRHVEQWHQFGFLNFIKTYLKENKKGYDCNALEEDARSYAGEDKRCK